MLDQVLLTNFKAFSRADIPLAPLTLLTGLNSSGKSTVLQALALLHQSAAADMLDADGGLLLNGSMAELGVGRDVLHEDWVEDPGIAGEYLRIGVGIGGSTYTWTFSYAAGADTLDVIGVPGAVRPAHPLFAGAARGFHYLRADRVSPAAVYERSHETAIRQGSLGSHGEHTVNFLRHYQETPVEAAELRHGAAASASLLEQTEAWLGEISPGVNLEAAGIDGTDLVRLSFGFGGRSGLASSNRRRPTNVGFGLTYTLPIIVACLSSRPGDVLLVENPESHLHPRGQTRIADLIARASAAGAQVVVETHSDHVLNGIRLAVKRGDHPLAAENVALHYFAGARQSALRSPRIAADGMIDEWPEGFFDEWDSTLDALLD